MGKKVVFCNCGGEIVGREIKESALRFLKNAKGNSLIISDLCGLCVSDRPTVENILVDNEQTLVIACHPRAVKKLFGYSGYDGSFENVTFLNLREVSLDEITSTISSYSVDESIPISEMHSEAEWPSWYPVIDFSRCTACGQCADFCLFGVYEKTDGKVNVVNPKGCKNNCPACARICPQTAIIFPKYKQGGAISGSDSIDEVAEQQRLQQDMNSILGNDIYKALELRKAKRQSIIKDDAMRKAIEERDRARKNE
jgi:ferredoxin